MYPQWSTLLQLLSRIYESRSGERALAFGGYNNSSVLVCFESERNVLILPMMTNVKECRIFLSSLPSHLFEKYNNNATAKRAFLN
jgi:hypothetical protein